MDQFDDRPSRGRGAKFYRIEKRYSSFLALHNEVYLNLYIYIRTLIFFLGFCHVLTLFSKPKAFFGYLTGPLIIYLPKYTHQVYDSNMI